MEGQSTHYQPGAETPGFRMPIDYLPDDPSVGEVRSPGDTMYGSVEAQMLGKEAVSGVFTITDAMPRQQNTYPSTPSGNPRMPIQFV